MSFDWLTSLLSSQILERGLTTGSGRKRRESNTPYIARGPT